MRLLERARYEMVTTSSHHRSSWRTAKYKSSTGALNGPAVDQVLATEMVGGSNPGVNWLMADAQETVRDVARGVAGDGGVSVSLVDHLIYDAFGRQDTPQTATDPQLQTRIGFRGMAGDALGGVTVTGYTYEGPGGGGSGGGSYSGGGSLAPAAGLSYSVNGGWYDAVTETNVSGAAGIESGAVNAYTFMGNDPTTSGLAMRSAAMVSDAAVGMMDPPSGSTGGDTVVNFAPRILDGHTGTASDLCTPELSGLDPRSYRPWPNNS